MDSIKKKAKKALTVEEQIKNLKNKKLMFRDEEYAKKILHTISYSRLIKEYGSTFKDEKNKSIYKKGVYFEDILEVYYFDCELRHLLLQQIEKIEIVMKCIITNYFSLKYGIFGYLEADNFYDEKYFKKFKKECGKLLKQNRRNHIVVNYKNNYEDENLPMYAFVEIFTFGTLSNFFLNLKKEDRNKLSKQFNMKTSYFLENYLSVISNVRNVCAHYGRLYNRNLVKGIRLSNSQKKTWKSIYNRQLRNNNIFSALFAMKNILEWIDGEKWNEFLDNLEILFNQSKVVNIKLIGFFDGWKDYLKC